MTALIQADMPTGSEEFRGFRVRPYFRVVAE